MRKSTTTSFHHGNPFGRLVSTLLAFGIATLLVVGSGAAYADDTDPAVAVSKKATTTSVVKAQVTPALVGNAACQDSANTMVGGFEIDADPCADEDGIDFSGGCPPLPAEPGCPGSSVDDEFGDDGNWFTQGSSENDNPATWTLTGSSNTGKADIGTAWAWSHTYSPGDIDPGTAGVQLAPDDGHVYAYFGFTNDSTAGGTQDYSLEYNQADPVNGKPVRTVGDLLFHFFANGSKGLEYKASYLYTDEYPDWTDDDCVESGNLGAGWCPFALPADAYVSASSPSGEYAEGSIDITRLFGEGNCSPTFGTTFLRSAPGSFFTSELKDYVAPIGVETASTCGSLVITKTDADTHDPAVNVAGGVYRIVGDPRPDGAGAHDPTYQLCIYDGPTEDLGDLDVPAGACDELIADGHGDGTVTIPEVEPGDYTVTEVVPPPGYMLNGDATDSDDVTVGSGESTVEFANRKIWQPLTIDKTADGTHGARYFWSITKQIAPTADGPWSDHPLDTSPLVKDVEAGGDTSLYYRVQVRQDHVSTSGYVVKGGITVANGNGVAVVADIAESLTGCTLDSNGDHFPLDDVSVPAGGATYQYTCDLGDDPVDAGTNTATVTWDMDTYPQATDALVPDTNPDHYTDSDDDGYAFVEAAPIDKSVTIHDDHAPDGSDWTIAWGDDDTTEDGDPVGVYDSGVYAFDTEADTGTCAPVITNTATIRGDNDADIGHTSENGRVCVEDDLSVDVSSDETLVRTFPWDLDKSTTTPTVTVLNGRATAHYQVVVTALDFVDGDWTMTGSATITNPNDFVAKQVSGLDIAYSGGGVCTPTDDLPLVAADDSAVVHFSCDFGDPATRPEYTGEVTATVRWDAGAETADDPTPWQVGEGGWLGDATLVDEFVKVFDDHAVPGAEDPLFGGAQLRWQDVFDSTEPADHQVAVAYDHTYSSGLPAAGACRSIVNTAWVSASAPPVEVDRAAAASEDALASDDATVRACTPAVAPPIVSPPQVRPPAALPNTGGPNLWLLLTGLVLVLGGAGTVAGQRLKGRRS